MKTRLVHFLSISPNGAWSCSCGALGPNKKSAETHENKQIRKSGQVIKL